MTALLGWLNRYRPSTHTLVGLLTVFQTAYLADSEMQAVINRIIGAHPTVHAVTGYCLLVLALYRNGAASDKK
jgi:hypothetical protein